MHNIDHPNVVRFETSFQGKNNFILDSGWYFIVMEYCDMGNLLTYQSKIANKTLGLAKASKILLQILNGILTIHSQNIIHRDIKCENIFLKKNSKGNGYQCKIGDFGFAK
jgi:NIMA (never in mitosis gene a)-related kinase